MSEKLDNEEFLNVHPLTPLLRFWTLILALIAGFAFNINAEAVGSMWGFIRGEHDIALWPLLLSIGGFLLVCGLIWIVSRLWWKATGYRLSDEEIQMKRGVLSRQLRTARFDRIQAVDIVESVIARIFRVAAVRVETAGGNDSVIEIAFLKRADAETLRTELIRASHGQRETVQTETTITADVQEPSWPAVVPEIPIRRSLASAALSLSTIILLLGIVIVLLTPLGLAVALPFIVGIGPALWGIIDKSWKYTAVLDDEVLNVSYGLADRRRQSIPLARIHGVAISQPLLWRLTGWWTVSVTVVGYGAETKQSGTAKILPVGSKDLALQLLEVVSSLNTAEIAEYADPEQMSKPSYRSPNSARWVSPIDRQQQGVTLVGDGPRAAIVHLGRIVRRMAVIDLKQIQELTLNRGPIQRILGLSSVRFDVVPGPVQITAQDLSYSDGMELLNVLRKRKLPELVPVQTD